MNEAGKHKGHFSERLPGHKPDKDLWAGIAGGLEGGSLKSLSERLPVHKPAKSIWGAIAKNIPVPWYSIRSIYFRSTLAVILILLLGFFLPKFTGENFDDQTTSNQTIINKPKATESIVSGEDIPPQAKELPEASIEKKGISEKQNDQENSQIERTPIASEKQVSEPALVNPYKIDDDNVESLADVNVEEDHAAENAEVEDFESEMSNVYSVAEVNDDRMLAAIPPKFLYARPLAIHNSSSPGVFVGSGNQYRSYSKDICYEAGVFAQPSFIHNISTINDDWYLSPGFGFSLAMINKKLILETGLSYMKMEFEDKVEIDYYALVFMGTVINTENYEWEEYVNEEGDTLARQIYTVELIDVYDSTFVEEEKNDLVKLSGVTIPFTVGYRFSDNGRFYFDLKTGLDMMIITGKVIPGNPEPVENIKVVDVQNSLADKYSVKWKYHLALGAGFRAGDKLSVYAEPALWWYPEGIRKKGSNEMKNPFEAGLKFGLRWAF